MTLKFEDLPEGSQQALMTGKRVTASSPELQAELDTLKVEAAERKAAAGPAIAKPVYALDRAATLAQQVKVTRALKVLHGEGVQWQEIGPKLAYFTAGARCYCRACDTFLRRVAGISYIEFPGGMFTCARCGNKRCPQAHYHEDVCLSEIGPESADPWADL